MTKVCRTCNKEKHFDAFGNRPDSKDGKVNQCRDCRKQYLKEYYGTERGRLALIKQREKYRETDHGKRAIKRFQESEKGRTMQRKSSRRQALRWPEKTKARSFTNHAIRDKRLMRGPCEICGVDSPIEAHHEDYSKPLLVNWLCVKHHRELHQKGETTCQA